MRSRPLVERKSRVDHESRSYGKSVIGIIGGWAALVHQSPDLVGHLLHSPEQRGAVDGVDHPSRFLAAFEDPDLSQLLKMPRDYRTILWESLGDLANVSRAVEGEVGQYIDPYRLAQGAEQTGVHHLSKVLRHSVPVR